MHTAEAARGRGVGRRLVEHLVGVARERGFRRLSLETGSGPPFAAARGLYASAGFVPCGPFADYAASPNSAYMTLTLPGAADPPSLARTRRAGRRPVPRRRGPARRSATPPPPPRRPRRAPSAAQHVEQHAAVRVDLALARDPLRPRGVQDDALEALREGLARSQAEAARRGCPPRAAPRRTSPSRARGRRRPRPRSPAYRARRVRARRSAALAAPAGARAGASRGSTTHREQLEHVVLQHVAQRAGRGRRSRRGPRARASPPTGSRPPRPAGSASCAQLLDGRHPEDVVDAVRGARRAAR